MDRDSPSPPPPLPVEEQAYFIAPRPPVPGQPYKPYHIQDVHPKYVNTQELNEVHESRERRHAALAVLDDFEMLLFHAVANNESIPQTRQRFMYSLTGRPQDTPPAKYIVHDVEAGRLLQTQKADAAVSKSASGRRPMSNVRGEIRGEVAIVDVVEVNAGWRNEWLPPVGVMGGKREAETASSSSRKGKGRASS